jgi:beta-N-acetylhexosaminidase
VDVTDADLRRLALGTLLPGFDGTTAPGWFLELLDEGLAGVVVFERNVADDPGEGTAGLVDTLRRARPDLVVAIDEEGGDVTRLDARRGSDLPGAAALGVVDDESLTRRVGAGLGHRLRAEGITVNLAPVADVRSDPTSPIIGVRSFGADAVRVARQVAAFVDGQQSQRVAATVKHFPGHGATADDSHHTVPEITAPVEVLRERELEPFRAGIGAGVQVVMTAHVRYPSLDDVPATLSRRILTDLLRDELGYDGVVMSDGLDMHAISRTVGQAEGAVRAIAAGVDAVCIGGESTGPEVVEQLVDSIGAAVRDGRLSVERLRDATRRLERLRAWTRGPASPATPPGEGSPVDRPGEQAARRALDVHGVAPLDRAPLVLECHDEPTVAAGAVPWAIGQSLCERMPGTAVVALTSDQPDPLPALAQHRDRPVVLSVRGLARRPWQREVLAVVRARRRDVVVVEHDLPGDRGLLGGHHICTYSGSRVSADAAADVLAWAAYP